MNKKILIIIIVLILIAVGIFTFWFLNNQNNTSTTANSESNALVLYFSRSGNTETVAQNINAEVNGNILELETVQSYPEEYNELADFAEEERDNNERPELKTDINIEDYDIIFLGYPIWFSDMPMAIYSFLDKYDLTGKTIAPFVTHGGSGLSETPDKIKQLQPNATVTEGLAISSSNVDDSKESINEWLEKIKY